MKRNAGTSLGVRDLLAEAVAGILQRPGRSALTMLGTVLGVGAFVAVLGLTTTANGQIGKRFSLQKATTVTVNETVPDSDISGTRAVEPSSFPPDADARVRAVNGAVAGGVWWPAPIDSPVFSTSPLPGGQTADGLTAYAASAGAVTAMGLHISSGVPLNDFHVNTRQQVVLLGKVAARQLGISRLDGQPAIFINGRPFTVIGVYDDSARLPEMLLGMIIPTTTSTLDYGPPGPHSSVQMLISTRIGAAPQVARQAPFALRPDKPHLLHAVPPPDPHALQDHVAGDLTALFLGLATICLVIGAVGIVNTALVSVLERTEEIGLRRSLGARPRHIAAQFLAECTAIGTLGGLAGTSAGIVTVVSVAAVQHWSALLEPSVTLPAPLLGTITGLLAGAYPALRAAGTDPLVALRSA